MFLTIFTHYLYIPVKMNWFYGTCKKKNGTFVILIGYEAFIELLR